MGLKPPWWPRRGDVIFFLLIFQFLHFCEKNLPQTRGWGNTMGVVYIHIYIFDFPIFVCALYDWTRGAYEYPSIWLEHYRKTSEMTKNLDPEISDYTFFLIRTNLIRTPRLRFGMGRRAKSKTNDHYGK